RILICRHSVHAYVFHCLSILCSTSVSVHSPSFFFFFFFNDTAPTEIYTLSLHYALPISCSPVPVRLSSNPKPWSVDTGLDSVGRSEEHTSELQSHLNLVCRLLLEKKKIKIRELCTTHINNII